MEIKLQQNDKTDFINNKRYLIKHNENCFICSISKNNKIKCTSVFSNKDTFYFGNTDSNLGELIGLFTL